MHKIITRGEALSLACGAITAYISERLGHVEFLRVTTQTDDSCPVGNGQTHIVTYRSRSLPFFLRLYKKDGEYGQGVASDIGLDDPALYQGYDDSPEAYEAMQARFYEHVKSWSGDMIDKFLMGANPDLKI